jgi:choline kinase
MENALPGCDHTVTLLLNARCRSCYRETTGVERGRLMAVIFLAAGRGSRMGVLTSSSPKALLRLPTGRSILQTNLDRCCSVGELSSILVVGGYQWEALQQFCQQYKPACVSPIYNASWELSGPVMSIEAGISNVHAEEECIVIANGDTVFSLSVFEKVPVCAAGVWLISSLDKEIEADDMLVSLAADGSVQKAEKAGRHTHSGFVSAGMLVATGADAKAALRDATKLLIGRELAEKRARPWHDLIELLSSIGHPVRAVPVPRSEWREFDSADCLSRYSVPQLV